MDNDKIHTFRSTDRVEEKSIETKILRTIQRFLMFRPNRLLENLRRFRYPHLLPLSQSWPICRRSAVLIMLFVGQRGELRVLLTQRSKGLNSFAGQISLPGGKANSFEETFETIAKRETEEEIGITQDTNILREKSGVNVENLSFEMPCYLSRTFLSVKPIICVLRNDTQRIFEEELPFDGSKLKIAINPDETSSIFSVPLVDMIAPLLPKDVHYCKEWIDHRVFVAKWGELRWPLRHYYYPLKNPCDVDWLKNVGDDGLEKTHEMRDLWGLTAKILCDVARIAQGMVSNDKSYDIGHEELIYGLKEFGGQLSEPTRTPWEASMARGSRDHRFGDVIPRFYMDKLTRITPKY